MFEELDYRETPLGAISLRRRSEPRLGGKVLYEVKLGEEFLMSSLFVEAEEQLAILALQSLDTEKLDVVVGGLGLGYTAAKALENEAVRSLLVIEVMAPVISWHQLGLVPLGDKLALDSRCSLVHGDFFKLAGSSGSFDPDNSRRLFHAVLLDIDHSPSHWLDASNSAFYTDSGLTALAASLHPGGVFGLWSNDPPDEAFTGLLNEVFSSAKSQRVTFPNPYTEGESSSTIYLAYKEAARNN
jgi:spermidine synthase